MKGIVMELENKRAVVLRRDGVFETCPAHPEWRIGDLVSVTKKRSHMPRALIAMAACLVFFFAAGFGGFSFYFQASAVVSIDVNPSIELYLNRLGRVIRAEAVNKDAEGILNAVSLSNLTYKDAIEKLVPLFEAYQDNYMLVTVQSEDTSLEENVVGEFQHATQGAADVRTVDAETLHSAHGHGMTAGKYLMVEELRSLDPTINVSEYSHHAISDIKEEIDSHNDHEEKDNHESSVGEDDHGQESSESDTKETKQENEEHDAVSTAKKDDHAEKDSRMDEDSNRHHDE